MSLTIFHYLESNYEAEIHTLNIFVHGILIEMIFTDEELYKALDVYDVIDQEMKLNWKYSK